MRLWITLKDVSVQDLNLKFHVLNLELSEMTLSKASPTLKFQIIDEDRKNALDN